MLIYSNPCIAITVCFVGSFIIFYSIFLLIGSFGEVYHSDWDGAVSSIIPICSTYHCYVLSHFAICSFALN